MESNDKLTNSDEVENHSLPSTKITEIKANTDIETETITKTETETKTEINSVEWVVGYFENENLYSVIPSNWLLKVNDSWYSKWPNSSIKSTVETRIINATEPAKTWKYYPVQVIKRYDSYLEAEQETFSCLSVVDQDSLGRGKRKKKSNFRHYDLSEDSDSESSVSIKNKGRPTNHKKHARKSLNHDSVNAASSSNEIESHQESCSSPSSSNVQNNGTPRCEVSNSNSSNISSRRKKKNLKKENDKYMSFVFECIDRIDNSLNTLGKELIRRKVEAITRETLSKLEPESLVSVKEDSLVKIKQEPIDELDTLEEVEISLLDEEFLSNFPMTELDDIINLELRLVNCPEFKEMFVSYLNSIGGVDIKNYVKRILSNSFTNRLATQCTWRGYHGNFELQRLNMIKTMCDVSKTIFGDSIETAFEVYVKEWFRRGKQRYSRQINTVRPKTTS